LSLRGRAGGAFEAKPPLDTTGDVFTISKKTTFVLGQISLGGNTELAEGGAGGREGGLTSNCQGGGSEKGEENPEDDYYSEKLDQGESAGRFHWSCFNR
jgi:hypothetical protein